MTYRLPNVLHFSWIEHPANCYSSSFREIDFWTNFKTAVGGRLGRFPGQQGTNAAAVGHARTHARRASGGGAAHDGRRGSSRVRRSSSNDGRREELRRWASSSLVCVLGILNPHCKGGGGHS